MRETVTNTKNPERIVDSFIARLQGALEEYHLLRIGINGVGDGMRRLEKIIATDFAFRLCIEWEWFRHSWHLAAINKNSTNFVKKRNAEIRDSLIKSPALQIALGVQNPQSIRLPSRLNMAQLEAISDPSGKNLTFANVSDWKTAAERDLDGKYAKSVKGIAASEGDATFLELVSAIRNHLAHNSDSSLNHLNQVARFDLRSSKGLKGTVNKTLARDRNRVIDVGAYLVSKGSPKRQRVEIVCQRLIAIARKLVE